MRTDAHESKTKLLDAALRTIRTKGYTATTVDDICREAGVTKGSFFHHFKGKEDLALAATGYWNDMTSTLFSQAPYQQIVDARERLLGYIDFRTQLLQGDLPDVTCLLGTMVQETFETYPTIRAACEHGISSHAQTVADIAEEAKAEYAPQAPWAPMDLALYIQASIQGAFILAKAKNSADVAVDCMTHLRAYIESVLPEKRRARAPGSARKKT